MRSNQKNIASSVFWSPHRYGHLSADEAKDIQRSFAPQASIRPFSGAIRYVAGADTAFIEGSDEMFAAIVVLDKQSWQVVEVARTTGTIPFPYVPGLLSFREIPLLFQAYKKLSAQVDLILCDGHGLIHPRSFGLACHLGVLLDKPAVGCGKTHFMGECSTPDEPRGSWSPVEYQGRTVGRLLRTQDGVRPIYVSIGHDIDLEQATDWTLRSAHKYRLPEPVRLADIEVNAMRRRAQVPPIKDTDHAQHNEIRQAVYTRQPDVTP